MKKLILCLLGLTALTGCNIRAVAVLETGEAVYGKINIAKEQEYELNKKDYPQLWEKTEPTTSNSLPPATLP